MTDLKFSTASANVNASLVGLFYVCEFGGPWARHYFIVGGQIVGVVDDDTLLVKHYRRDGSGFYSPGEISICPLEEIIPRTIEARNRVALTTRLFDDAAVFVRQMVEFPERKKAECAAWAVDFYDAPDAAEIRDFTTNAWPFS